MFIVGITFKNNKSVKFNEYGQILYFLSARMLIASGSVGIQANGKKQRIINNSVLIMGTFIAPTTKN